MPRQTTIHPAKDSCGYIVRGQHPVLRDGEVDFPDSGSLRQHYPSVTYSAYKTLRGIGNIHFLTSFPVDGLLETESKRGLLTGHFSSNKARGGAVSSL